MTQSTQPPDLPLMQSSAASPRPANRNEQAAPAKPWRLDAAIGTHPGKTRDHNEDAVRGTPTDFPAAVQRGYLFIVADGMGGHNAGEIASSEAVVRVYQQYYEDSDPDIHRRLENAMRRTSSELFNQAQTNPQQQGMGTTFTAVVIKDNRAFVAHVGDSRLYLIRNGQFEQLTQDHSWVEEQVRAGVLTRLQAENHPQRNVITRALATMPDVKVEHYERELHPGDALLLCSDGLNTEVGDAQIAALTTKAASAEDAVARLIQLANDNGGEDNVSVIVIRLSDGAAAAIPAAAVAPATNRSGRKSFILPVIFGIVGLLLLAALVAMLFNPRPSPAGGGAQSAKTATAAAPAILPGLTLAVTPFQTSSETGSGATPSSAGGAAAPTVTLAAIRPPETPAPTRAP
jgi:serine/threonine protein phosphatase PrpC